MPDSIVVLDAFTANPGDLDWQGLAALGHLRIYDRTPAAELLARAAGFPIVLTNKTPLSAAAIAALPDLRYLGILATGCNIVDLEAARSAGIVVCNVPAYSTASVAQTVFALLLELTHRVGHHAAAVRQGRWAACPDFSFWDFPLLELAGRTLGIVGYGQIGRAVARIAQAMEIKVIATRRNGATGWDAGVEMGSLEKVLSTSDVVTLHCPLTPETRGMISAQSIAQMKRSALLINTSRGPLIVESDLAEALEGGRLAGAALDVLSVEPPRSDNPLLRARNCLITPHFAWATRAARARLIATATENVRAFQAGTPRNVVV